MQTDRRTSPKRVVIAGTALLATVLTGAQAVLAAGGTVATGSAGGANAQGQNARLPRCAEPMGTLAVVEDTAAPWYSRYNYVYHLGPTTPVIKMLVQQSNCFVVVERGRGISVAMGERDLRDSGEMRQGSNFQKGQMVAADYALSPSVTFSDSNAGGVGGLLGGIIGGRVGAVLGGGVKVKDASTILTLIDNRSSVQLAAAEGSTRRFDLGLVSSVFGAAGGGGLGGYTNTNEGKMIVAAFTDAYINIVHAVENYRTQEVRGGLGTGGTLTVGR